MERAREFCKKNFGDLAVIEDNSERRFLAKYVRSSFIPSGISNLEQYAYVFIRKDSLWS